MEIYIINCIAGFLSFDSDFKLNDYVLFNDEEIVSKIHNINNNILTDEEIKIIENTPDCDEIIIETNKRLSDYKDLKNYDKIIVQNPNKGGEFFRENVESILKEINYIKDYKDYRDKIVKINNEISILKMKESSQEEDKLLIQGINSIDEIDESISQLIERIREWETIYFPEIETIHNNEAYIKFIADYSTREEAIKNNPDIFKDIMISNGADLKDEDIFILNDFAKSLKALQISRTNIENYIENKMDTLAPNLKNLIGASLGAKLIAHVGSLKRLSTLSASTVQIIGAEKALFRHLKTGENPPKHGLIYQSPYVRGSNYWVRGKIARKLALKITFAVRKDVYTDEINTDLKEDLEKEIEKINKENPFAKTKNKKEKSKFKTKSKKKSRKNTYHKKTKKQRRRKK